jgi:hypothetical protein
MLANGVRRGYEWRAAGSAIVKLWRRDLIGRAFAQGWPEFDRSIAERALGGVTGRLQPFVGLIDLAWQDGRSLQVEVVWLPIAAKRGEARQVLCGVFPFAEPEWLGRSAPLAFELVSLRPIRIEPCPEPSSAAPRRKSRVVLRVIEGGS